MATTLYLHDELADVSRGRNDNNKAGSAVPWRALAAHTTVGTTANVVTTVNTTAGTTLGIEPGSPRYEWLSPPVINAYWGYETKKTASDAENNDQFGFSVACSADSSVIVVGTYFEDGAGTDRGAVYIYSGSNWTTETKKTASDAADDDYFGYSVACSADGSVVVVGAVTEDGAGTSRGAAYIYSGSNWGTETKKTASDAADSDSFGNSVACSADGSVVVVGAPGEDGAGTGRGKVYIYSGSNWTTETMKTASDAADNDKFGNSVACSADGSVVAVGAYDEDGAGTGRGKVYIYSGTTWGTETMKTASDAADNDQFGFSVACSANGSVVVVGAPFEDGAGTDRGKVYIYSGTTWGTETMKTASDAENADQFGRSVACSADGSVVVVGAHQEYGAGTLRGAVYIYSGSSWGTETKKTASDTANGDKLGGAVACSADGAVVVAGAIFEDGAGTDRGAAYIYSSGISDTVTFNICAHESNMSANATVAVIAERVDNVGAVVSTIVDSSFLTELGTANARKNWTASPTATRLNQGDRIRIRVYFDDASGVTMASTYSCSMNYDGTNANEGDSNVQFTENLVFMYSHAVPTTLLTPTYDNPDPDTIWSNRFGASIACTRSGSRLFVGAPAYNVAAGRCYIFDEGASDFASTLDITGAAAGDQCFGGTRGVACSESGSVLVVGSSGYAPTSGWGRGKAYVLSGTNWGTQTDLVHTGSDINSADYGMSVACSFDGSIVAVGRPGNYTTDTNGRVHMHTGSSWGTETVIGMSSYSGGGSPRFGDSVALSRDGSILVVGAPQYTATSEIGCLFIYSGSSWGTETIKQPSGLVANGIFGKSVSCSADGSVVAAISNTKVYVYSGSSWGTETQLADIAGGKSVLVTEDGSTIFVGGYSGTAPNPRNGYVHVCSGTNWATRTTLSLVYDPYELDFGAALAVPSDFRYIVVGAPCNVNSVRQSFAYVFGLNAATVYLKTTNASVDVGSVVERMLWTTRG